VGRLQALDTHYTQQHKYYCGIDLHARSMYLCRLDQEGTIVLHKNLKSNPANLLRATGAFRDDIVVAVECIFTGYWLAGVCTEEKIPFVLGHALYMKAIHGGKAKNIAILLRGGMLPQAYVYPRQMRATRDLLRCRIRSMRKRFGLLSHIQNTNSQYNLDPFGKKIAYKANREGVAEQFDDPSVQLSIAMDLRLLEQYDKLLNEVELYLVRHAKHHDANAFYRLRSVPGIGKILALSILYEVHDIARFARVQDFISYCRLVNCPKESAGKRIPLSVRWWSSAGAATFVLNSVVCRLRTFAMVHLAFCCCLLS
jgi:transposase